MTAEHLAFLALLLLTAPLVAVGRRWRGQRSLPGALARAGLLTALVLGGLALGAVLPVGGTAAEVLVAASVAGAAVHAVRPLAPRASGWLAGVAGLGHGALLAPAEVPGTALALVVAVVVGLPLAVLVSRSRVHAAVRAVVAGAGVVVAGASWVAALTAGASVLQPLVDVVAGDPAVSLLVLAAAAFLVWELFPPAGAEEPPVPAERERVGVG
ncbi:hypothetical protein [Blastococcus sp. KM273128]|uniref:hypothetical protein n=1 Tax=Blastococcus sp. KM273128 TaxID=2570314 RepID=UPI001F204B3C|nr:hypothetical protein [Blastococcus sp. KM273128]